MHICIRVLHYIIYNVKEYWTGQENWIATLGAFSLAT